MVTFSWFFVFGIEAITVTCIGEVIPGGRRIGRCRTRGRRQSAAHAPATGRSIERPTNLVTPGQIGRDVHRLPSIDHEGGCRQARDSAACISAATAAIQRDASQTASL